jgi:hypothetical protein
MSVAFTTSASGSVAVDAPAPDLRWLEAFLAPAFNLEGNASDPIARVRLVDTPAASAPARTGAGRVAFVLDRRPVRLSESAAADALIYADPGLQVTYSVRDRGRDVVVHRGPHEDLTRIALMRVVRECAHNALVEEGGVVIHAAAFAGARGAVLVTAPKGVGKTTLLAWLLSHAGVSYLANDRVGIIPNQLEALAIPTIVAVRSGTRRLLPAFGERLRGLGRFTMLEPSSGDPPDRTVDSWYFAPRQFAGALSCDLSARAPLAAIVSLRPEAPPGRLRHTALGDAADLLVEALLGAQPGVFVSEVFRPAAAVPEVVGRLRAACRRLACSVPCFELAAPVTFDRETLEGLRSLCG